MATPQKRSIEVDEERMLAGKLAGVLFLTASVSIVLQLFLPGVENRHWLWVVGLSAVCVAWALFCPTLARPEEHGAWFWHVPATLSIALIAGLMAATGGAESPARFYVFFLLFYACYFFQRRYARLYVAGCVGVALTPLAYDGTAVSEGYLRSTCASRRDRCRCAIPSPTCPTAARCSTGSSAKWTAADRSG